MITRLFQYQLFTVKGSQHKMHEELIFSEGINADSDSERVVEEALEVKHLLIPPSGHRQPKKWQITEKK